MSSFFGDIVSESSFFGDYNMSNVDEFRTDDVMDKYIYTNYDLATTVSELEKDVQDICKILLASEEKYNKKSYSLEKQLMDFQKIGNMELPHREVQVKDLKDGVENLLNSLNNLSNITHSLYSSTEEGIHKNLQKFIAENIGEPGIDSPYPDTPS